MKHIWIVWKKTKENVAGEPISANPAEIHIVCSSRALAAQENKRLHKNNVKSWIGKYIVDHRVHWSPDDADPNNNVYVRLY